MNELTSWIIMIHPYIPYSPTYKNKNIGWVYNNFMEMIGEDDWACFVDHDAMFTIPDWYTRLESIVNAIDTDDFSFSDTGLVTAVTNRIGNTEQIIFPKDSDEAQNHDMYFHRSLGKKVSIMNANLIVNAKNLISGILMLTPKRVWKKTGGFKDGFLGVDNDYDAKVRKAGYRTVIMHEIYMYHWYRADGRPMQGWGYDPEKNLKKI